MRLKKGALKTIFCLALAVCIAIPFGTVDTHAEIFYLQTGRRFDSTFSANYYPDLKAKYGYNAHKLLDHYLNYGNIRILYIFTMSSLKRIRSFILWRCWKGSA